METPNPQPHDVNPPQPAPAVTTETAQAGPEAAGQPEPAVPQGSWLVRTGPYAVVAALILYLIITKLGLGGLAYVALVALGLGLVIFIHELGHFSVAKWCDVHVEAFSIGFGPPLPGCRWQKGETTYMVAVFPLGGYVKMVGEGAENDEEPDDPRSFKNKAVWQRMLIISAGVFMNMVMGSLCFIFVYMTKGVEQQPGIIGEVDAGSRAWQLGAQSGMDIYKIGTATKPSFEDLMQQVALSSQGEKLDFWFGFPGKTIHKETVEPRLGKNDSRPMIGVAPPESLQLARLSPDKREHPVYYDSPAAQAKPPFEFKDRIVACSDPKKNGEVTPLPTDPRYAKQLDYFAFRERMQLLAGKPVVIRVERASGEKADIEVPGAFHRTFGLRMRMGQVTAVRNDSPAKRAGVKVKSAKNGDKPAETGDILAAVEVDNPQGGKIRWVAARNPAETKDDKVDIRDLDPIKLPYELSRWAAGQKGARKIKLTITREEGHDSKTPKVLEMEWDDSFDFDQEVPINLNSPVAIAGLGLAYEVESTVDDVAKDSPAARAKTEDGSAFPLLKGDVIKEVCVYDTKDKGQTSIPAAKGRLKYLFFQKDKVWTEVGPAGWPRVFTQFQTQDFSKIQFKVDRSGTETEVVLEAAPDKDWPLVSRGMLLHRQSQFKKASNLGEAMTMGLERSLTFVNHIYQTLRALVTGRLGAENFSGPIGIARIAYSAAEYDFYTFMLFLGIISVNLAVINFLPIPLLDGGHMVFLIYEGIRGKPASEGVRVAATYAGLAIVASLMLFVLFLDVKKYLW